MDEFREKVLNHDSDLLFRQTTVICVLAKIKTKIWSSATTKMVILVYWLVFDRKKHGQDNRTERTWMNRKGQKGQPDLATPEKEFEPDFSTSTFEARGSRIELTRGKRLRWTATKTRKRERMRKKEKERERKRKKKAKRDREKKWGHDLSHLMKQSKWIKCRTLITWTGKKKNGTTAHTKNDYCVRRRHLSAPIRCSVWKWLN